MNSHRKIGGWILLGTTLLIWAMGAYSLFGQSLNRDTNEIRIVELQGAVEVSPKGAQTWVLTQTNQPLYPFDRLRTGPNSRVALQWPGESAVQFGASTELEILPPNNPDAEPGLHLVRGILSFFHRDKPGRIQVITRGAVAGIEGTEFVLKVDDADNTTISVVDGKVRFTNDLAGLVLTNGEQAVAAPGRAPARTAGFVANNVLQWSFYYPAVLDLADLSLSSEERNALSDSLAAYGKGDLQVALAKYPAGRKPASDAERVYYAALILCVGQVDQAESTLASLSSTDASDRPQRLAAALRQLIAAVKRQTISSPAPQLATEYLAASYYQQSLAKRDVSLGLALSDARQAAAISPQFGFAWARVAELEFSFGHTRAAMAALDKSLELAPRNAQALALKGFLLAAQNRTREALEWFEKALQVDSSLGNAWLGRGLCRIRLGDNRGGREDLLMAAALEPQRAELRSYLGKAFGDAGDFPRAMKEFQNAKKLDPQDPTAWLYSALLKQDYNRINEAIRDLEESQKLNDNRSVYRSQFLLDQDQAVRSANLAGIYSDAGMDQVAQWEAARAVNYDYANYSAHLFLANSYAQLTDPNLVNLRYETPTEAEFLIANLLAPVGAGPLSEGISQQEYSQLFAQNRAGLFSSTEYLSRGAWSELGGQYSTFDNFNYDFEGFYHGDPGQRPNDDIQERSISVNVKAQFTPQDSGYFTMQYNKDGGGELAELYNQKLATNSTLRYDERQEPILGLGYHHEWAPGVHTLVFGARLVDNLVFTNQAQPAIVFFAVPNNSPPPTQLLKSVQSTTFNELYSDQLEIYSGEVQQIFEETKHTTILGARAQYGHFDTSNLQDTPLGFPNAFPAPPLPAADQDITTLFRRFSVYGYHQWQLVDWLQLIGGVTYDRITFPENFRIAPLSASETTEDQVSPKAGMILHPATGSTVRFAFTRSLAGASLDQSYQIEPTQVAGFIQSFRSIIPESVVGANAGARFETYDLSLEQKFCTGTYLGLTGQILNSDINRVDGAFNVDSFLFNNAVPSSLREDLDYTEETVGVTANQLIGNEWSLGGSYNLSRAMLNDVFPGIGTNGVGFGSPPSFTPRERVEGILNTLDLFAIYNHPCGFFAEGEALWYRQRNIGYSGMEPGDDFWQFNAYAGYRFPRRRAQLTLGVLNLAGRNYQLNPLNLYNELPRERTLAVEFSFNF